MTTMHGLLQVLRWRAPSWTSWLDVLRSLWPPHTTQACLGACCVVYASATCRARWIKRALSHPSIHSFTCTMYQPHAAELKQVDVEDSRYTSVSMEFDNISLRPTYRLCWGAAGASNALSIASTLGFDR